MQLESREVQRFSFAADDGHKVLATRCTVCRERIRYVLIGRPPTPPSVLFRVTLKCCGEAETADRAYVKIDSSWAGGAK